MVKVMRNGKTYNRTLKRGVWVMKWKRYGNYLVVFYEWPQGIAIFRLKNEDI